MDGGRTGSAVAVGGAANIDGWRAGAGIGAGTHPLGTMFTRRRLLAAGGAAALAATVGKLPGAITALSEIATPAYLRRSSYVPLIGERFELTAPGGDRVVPRLVSVMDLGIGKRMKPLAGAEDAFALLFHSPIGPRIEQDVMSLEHPVLGRFRLLVSPASTGRPGQDYSATINRARPPGL